MVPSLLMEAMLKRRPTVPSELASLVRGFDKWRNQRPHLRSPMPDNLLTNCVVALRIHRFSTVARVCGVNPGSLRNALKRLKTPERARAPRGSAVAVRVAEVVGIGSPTPGSILEIMSPSGWCLRLTGSDTTAAMRVFLEAKQ